MVNEEEILKRKERLRKKKKVNEVHTNINEQLHKNSTDENFGNSLFSLYRQ